MGTRVSHVNSDNMDETTELVARMELSSNDVQRVVNESKALRDALGNLDIDVNDHTRLGDILDPDRSGTITSLELINGLLRLRGHTRRSDTITVDLMVRSLQERVDEIYEKLIPMHEHTKEIL